MAADHASVGCVVTCSVEGCGSGVKARGLCSMHYQRARASGQLDEFPRWEPEDVPLICVCAEPQPFGFGECSTCHRPVVTFMSRKINAETIWPEEYARAVAQGAVPHDLVSAS